MAISPARTLEQGQLLPEFVAARGLAAVWIVLAHTLAMTLQGHAPVPRPVEYSVIIVDFFFVQSGFVLAHVYDAAWREGRFRYFTFLGKRLTRLWPLHAATLLAVLALVIAGRIVGHEPETPHDAWSFVVTLLMLHSTWLTSDLAWNWPSWSVSAEWCAYLVIPVFFLAADRVRGVGPRIVVLLGVFVVASLVSDWLIGLDIVELTSDGGAFRIVPSFFAGILLRRIFDDEPILLTMTPRIYAALVAGVVAVCAMLIWFAAPYDALWPPMVVLVVALAARASRPGPGFLRAPVFAWLGELSYAIYLTHGIVLTALFGAAEVFGLADAMENRVVLACLVPPATLLASQLAYVIVEKPGRRIMARLFERKTGRAALGTPKEGGMRP